MQKLTLLAAFALCIAACQPAEKRTESKADIVPLKDFFRDPEKAAYRISPNGEYIMYRAPHMGRMNVFVQKLGDTTATPITHETERSIGNAVWETDNTIIYIKDFGGDENYHVVAVNRDGSNLRDLTPWPKV